jgi:hypothetical protein
MMENCRKLGVNPFKWLRAIMSNVIEKTENPSLPQLDAISQ